MPSKQLRRREFIATLAGVAAAWPVAARAQQAARLRRIGVLMPLAPDDPEDQARLAAFHQGLQEAGWSVGRNVRIDTRWGAGDGDRIRKLAIELFALAPDVVLAVGTNTVLALRQASRTVPIVFTAVTDPIGGGLVESLAHPGGNATGFAQPEWSFAGKWLELLKEIAPTVTRAAVIRDTSFSGFGNLAAIQALASTLKVETTRISVQDAGEIERGIAAFARGSNGGLIVTPTFMTVVHRELIIALATRYRLPAVYPFRLFAMTGGLISYGADVPDMCRRAAGYVDRILKGDQPGNLPVQEPTKFELVVNLKTAKTLGLELPVTVLARADEVIE
jgi:putative ABC transport system substrate-binding protein